MTRRDKANSTQIVRRAGRRFPLLFPVGLMVALSVGWALTEVRQRSETSRMQREITELREEIRRLHSKLSPPAAVPAPPTKLHSGQAQIPRPVATPMKPHI